jgi:hypothetical protein
MAGAGAGLTIGLVTTEVGVEANVVGTDETVGCW